MKNKLYNLVKWFNVKNNQDVGLLFFVIILLHILDLVTTQIGLATGRMFELNPIARFIINQYGFLTLWIVKLSIAFLIGILGYIFKMKNFLLFFACFSLIPVVLNIIFLYISVFLF